MKFMYKEFSSGLYRFTLVGAHPSKYHRNCHGDPEIPIEIVSLCSNNLTTVDQCQFYSNSGEKKSHSPKPIVLQPFLSTGRSTGSGCVWEISNYYKFCIFRQSHRWVRL